MFRVAVGHCQLLQPLHLGTISTLQCLYSWWADARARDPRSCTPPASRVPHRDPSALPKRVGSPGFVPSPGSIRPLLSLGISAGSGRNVVAAGTIPAPCTGGLRDSVEQLPRHSPAPRSRQEADGEDTGHHFLRQDAGLSLALLSLQGRQGLGHQSIIAQGCQSHVPHTPGALWLASVPSPSWCGTCHHAPWDGHIPGAQPAGTSSMGPSATIPRCWRAWGRAQPSAAPGGA